VEDELRSLGATIASEAVRADILAQLEGEPSIAAPVTDAGITATGEIPPPEVSEPGDTRLNPT
jgi:hypothetical protein